jgi:hypothetical protein
VHDCAGHRLERLAARDQTLVFLVLVFHRSDQHSVTDTARPASLVSLYLLFISFAV